MRTGAMSDGRLIRHAQVSLPLNNGIIDKLP